jgi:penicillin-binding protein 2
LSASAVVIEIENGDILAMSSTPSFNPNSLVNGISNTDWSNLLNDIKRPLSNKSVSDAYPPGSLFKMIVAIAALEKRLISEDDEINCNGLYDTTASKHHCWLSSGHGDINLEKALKRSCDVYFYEIARRAGINAIAKTAKAFGLSGTFDLPVSAVSRGLIPDREWKKSNFGERWLLGDTLNAGIGQGYILTTPMQIAIMTARIATGKKIIPRLINAKGGKIIPLTNPVPLGFKNSTLLKIRDGMDAAVNDADGTAYKSRITNPKFKLAGKTGTAQVRRITAEERENGVTKNEDLPWEKRDHALFTGYAPTKNPKYAISVIVEHGGGGSAVAAPIARDIILYTLYGKLPSLSAYPKDQHSEIQLRLEELKTFDNKDTKGNKSAPLETQT